MLSPKIISRYQSGTLTNLRSLGMLTLGVMQQVHGMSVRAVQEGAGHSVASAFSTAGAIDVASSRVEDARELYNDSMHLVSGYLIDLVKVAESQWALSHRCVHASLQEAHHWAPREMEIFVSALDLALDAAESTTENLADAAVLVAKRLSDDADVLSAPVKQAAAPHSAHG